MVQVIDNENTNEIHFITADSEILFLIQGVGMLANSDSIMSNSWVDDGELFVFSIFN